MAQEWTRLRHLPVDDCEVFSGKNLQHTLWLFNIAMENGPFIDDFPIKTTIYRGFSMVMLNNQMVIGDLIGITSRRLEKHFPLDV